MTIERYMCRTAFQGSPARRYTCPWILGTKGDTSSWASSWPRSQVKSPCNVKGTSVVWVTRQTRPSADGEKRRTHMAQGNPRCLTCNGRGGFMSHDGWRRCHCVRGTKAAREAQRRLHSIGTEDSQLSLDEAYKQQQQEGRRRNG